jgi:hypothetical protein
MLYREIIAVCSEIHTKHINTLCEQNVEFVNVKPGGAYSNHCALKVIISWKRGTRWHNCLRHCAMSPKVAGSIPDGVIGIFH